MSSPRGSGGVSCLASVALVACGALLLAGRGDAARVLQEDEHAGLGGGTSSSGGWEHLARRGAEMARLAEAVYTLEQQVGRWTQVAGDDFGNKDHVAIYGSGSGECALVFQGSATAGHWVSNFQVATMHGFMGLGLGVHRGFAKELDKFFASPFASSFVQRLRQCGSVTAVGHSMGGAKAVLFAAVMNSAKHKGAELSGLRVDQVYTIGAPPVFCTEGGRPPPAFAGLRAVNVGDSVPSLGALKLAHPRMDAVLLGSEAQYDLVTAADAGSKGRGRDVFSCKPTKRAVKFHDSLMYIARFDATASSDAAWRSLGGLAADEGNNLASSAEDLAACKARCDATAGCSSITHAPGRCHLKDRCVAGDDPLTGNKGISSHNYGDHTTFYKGCPAFAEPSGPVDLVGQQQVWCGIAQSMEKLAMPKLDDASGEVWRSLGGLAADEGKNLVSLSLGWEECRAQCDANFHCLSFTYAPGRCHLKDRCITGRVELTTRPGISAHNGGDHVTYFKGCQGKAAHYAGVVDSAVKAYGDAADVLDTAAKVRDSMANAWKKIW